MNSPPQHPPRRSVPSGSADPGLCRRGIVCRSHYEGDTRIIVGARDPLSAHEAARAAITRHARTLVVQEVAEAAHHPQLTHPEQLARAMGVSLRTP